VLQVQVRKLPLHKTKAANSSLISSSPLKTELQDIIKKWAEKKVTVLHGYDKKSFLPKAIRTRLFWKIIKLYSSSFNPIFNSLNNKYLTSPGLLGKGTAQIKILKNNSTWPNSNDSLNPTDRMISAHPQASKGGKSTITKTLPTLDSPISTRECVAGKSDNKKYLFLYFILPIFFSTLKNSTAAIQPSLPKGRVVPCSGKYNHALIKSNLLVERMHKKLNNQIKQLRLLIKLMLNSDSALLRSRQWIRRHSGLQLPYGLTTLQPSLKNNIINKADQEQKKRMGKWN